MLVSRLARQAVTVALTGDGGDELFAGYDRYRLHGRLSSVVEHVPAWARAAAASSVLALPATTWDRAVHRVGPVLPRRVRRLSRPGEKLHKAARVLQHAGTSDLYHSVMSTWREPADVLREAHASREVPSPALAGRTRSACSSSSTRPPTCRTTCW